MKALSAALAAMLLPLTAAPVRVSAAEPAISWTLTPVPAGADPGKVAFERACAVCHAQGADHPGTSSLQIKYGGKLPAALEQRTDLKPELVRLYVRNGFAMMPRFRKTELSDEQVEAIARYLSRVR